MGRRVALLVATSLYGDPDFRSLRAPAGEAEELQRVLLAQGDFDEVEVLRNESKSRIESRIEDVLRSAGPQDMVLLYLSCHGIKTDRGELVFATCNTELDLVGSTAVSSRYVRSQLQDSQAGSKVVLLDCCYSGAFSGGLVPKSSDRIDLRPLAGRGTYVMTATSALEYAYEGEGFTSTAAAPSSLFTRAVLEGIRTGAADTDGDGRITGDELYHYVCRELHGRQSPSRETQMFGEVYIARVSAAAEIPPPVPAAPAPTAIGPLLVHPATQRRGPAGSTLRVAVGAHRVGDSWEPFLLGLTEPEDHWAVVGPAQSGKSQFLRTLLLGLASDSAPEEVRISVVDSESRFGAFARLPHVAEVLGPDEHDSIAEVLNSAEQAISTRRAMFRSYAFESLADFRAARRNRDLPDDGAHPDVFLVVDRWETFADENPSLVAGVEQLADKGTSFGVHVVVATRSWPKVPEALRPHLRGRVELGTPDGAAEREATAQGRPFRLVAPIPQDSESGSPHRDMLALIEEIRQRARKGTGARLDIEQALGDLSTFDPQSLWREPSDLDWLRAPIGRDVFGRVVEVDLNTAAEGGAGPHGMIVGPPGSGSTQTLSSLLFHLMLTHSPEELNVALLRGLPYNAYPELVSMPHVVSSAGAPSVTEWKVLPQQQLREIRREVARRQQRRDDAGKRPKLVVAIHNYVEAIAYAAGAADQLRELMALGADVGVHVVLQTHSISGRRFPEIEALCDFWIVHHTSEADSRAALGSSAATRLPDDRPGTALLKERAKPPMKFRAWSADEVSWAGVVARVNESAPGKAAEFRSPLADALTLGEVLGAPVLTERGLSAPDFVRNDAVPIGLVEVQEGGDVEPLTVPVNGHIVISGAAFSGKAFLTRSIVLALALTRTPEELHFYFLGAANWPSCAEVLSDLPHVAAVADLHDGESVEFIVRELLALLRAREQGDVAQDPAVVLVLDHWLVFRERGPVLLSIAETLAREGPAHRIQLIIGTHGFEIADPGLFDLFSTRMQLNREVPGTGVVGGRRFRAALPWFDADEDSETPHHNTRANAQRIAEAWPGDPASGPSPPPSHVPYAEAAGTGSPHVVLGRLAGKDRWAELDLHRTPHLLCLGEPGSGKTDLVRVVLAELERLYSAEEYHAMILDPKRHLLGEFAGGQYGYAAVREECERVLSEAVTLGEHRLALWRDGRAARKRKIFLVLSDLELLGTNSSQGAGNPVRPDLFGRLEQVADRGADLGFHLIVTRNSINIGDALHRGLLGRLRSTDCATVVLSGEEREDELVPGVRSAPRPPGRGNWIAGDRVEPIQLAHAPTG